jgi:lipoprotein-anchoring transpeptidase ErfK/SrfK
VSAEPLAALDHLTYLADHQQQAALTPAAGSRALPPDARSLDVGDLADGQWYLHLWAVDKAGQVGQPATLAVLVARTPPKISDVIFRSWAANPLYQTVPIRFTLSRPAGVDVTILAQVTSRPVRAYHLGHQLADQPIPAPWDGKDERSQVVPPGSYAFVIDLVDDAGNRVQARYNGLTITDKVIQVSLGKQSLTASAGSQVFLTTAVTTGGQALPTASGTFEILSKESPFVFHSPFAQGSQYWYPDVTAHQAMLFYQADADFIHDAPWRTVFGPGSNGPGVPGAAFTGSHGCVELPAGAMPKLYEWTPLGTPVIVAP